MRKAFLSILTVCVKMWTTRQYKWKGRQRTTGYTDMVKQAVRKKMFFGGGGGRERMCVCVRERGVRKGLNFPKLVWWDPLKSNFFSECWRNFLPFLKYTQWVCVCERERERGVRKGLNFPKLVWWDPLKSNLFSLFSWKKEKIMSETVYSRTLQPFSLSLLLSLTFLLSWIACRVGTIQRWNDLWWLLWSNVISNLDLS